MLARLLYEGILTGYLYKYHTYLEIGSFDGEGIAMLSKKFPDKSFYSIDPFVEDGNTINSSGVEKGKSLDKIRNTFIENTKDCKNIIHFDMTSEEFVIKELYENLFIDILFIDGDHSNKGTSTDLTLAILLSKNKRLFVVMDDLYLDGVTTALNHFKITYPGIKVDYFYDNINKVLTTAFFYLS